MAINIIFLTSPDDSAYNYHVGQTAVSFSRNLKSGNWIAEAGKPGHEDSPDKGNQSPDGSGRVVAGFDAPGVKLVGDKMPGGYTGTHLQYSATQALDAKGKPSGPTLYWKMTLKVVNGGATMSVAEITQQEYKDAQKKHDAATGAIGGSGGSWPSAGGSKTLRP